MHQPKTAIISLRNNAATVAIDLFGGAIISFRLNGSIINPLSFAFSPEQMPVNNKGGAVYQGHFTCIGRWGEPSKGEMAAGLPNHGEPANILWKGSLLSNRSLTMQVAAAKDGLHVDRTVVLDEESPVIIVKEKVTNINPLGRLFNIVQHPTLASPFLDEFTVIDCNATIGFDQAYYKDISLNVLYWSNAVDSHNNPIDLRTSDSAYNAVFSFIVNPGHKYGWITAYSPTHNLLIGYVWPRNNYPWIHLWQHFENDKIQYRGIEFGTAGIHQPFEEILNTATTVFEEKTTAYIDAGEVITKSYLSFTYATSKGFAGVEDILLSETDLTVKSKAEKIDVTIKLNESLTRELSR